MFDELRDASNSRPDLDDLQLPTFSVDNDAEATAAVSEIIERFGSDAALEFVRILCSGESPVYLRRVDAYRFAESNPKGFGDSGRAGLPGQYPPGSLDEFEFRCEVDGCPNTPLFVLSFTKPPVCRVHGKAMTLASPGS